MSFTDEELRSYFPIPCIDCFMTAGQQLGWIIKFRTFYLKIYENDINSNIVQGYTYAGNIPDLVFTEIVKERDFRKWASQFTKDNYLENYREFYE